MTEHIDYLPAIQEKRRLLDKLNRGLFVNEEWVGLIVLLAMTGWVAMADDLDQRRKHYAETWGNLS
jgi:hypothetical protein